MWCMAITVSTTIGQVRHEILFSVARPHQASAGASVSAKSRSRAATASAVTSR